MSKLIYTSVEQHFGKIFFRGYKDGKRVQVKTDYSPTLYVPTNQETTEYKSLFGKILVPKKFDSISQSKEWVKQNKDILAIHGNTDYAYDFIHRNFPGELKVSIEEINVQMCDIETTVEHGFPDVFDPNEEVLLITMVDLKTQKPIVCFGSREYHGKYKDIYKLCRDETDLLTQFIAHVEQTDPDVISGWNCVYFDIAYLGSRIEKVLGQEYLNRLSPFGKVERKVTTLMEREQLSYNIVGRTVLDLLDLYKKFRFVPRPSYKLDYIANAELGRKKLENPYPTFKQHYTDGWNHPESSFVDYNIIDAVLVAELEKSLGLIYLAVVISYMAKINYDDVYSPVKMWENLIRWRLHEKNTYVAIAGHSFSTGQQIMGGFVKDPVPGLYDWLVSFDATSLYPSIMMALNLSPETFVGMLSDITIDKFLKENYRQQNREFTLGANGAQYRKDINGIIPELTKMLFDNRKVAKKQMLDHKKDYQMISSVLNKRGIAH